MTDPRLSQGRAGRGGGRPLAAAALLALAACSGERTRPQGSPPADVFYPIRGTVTAIAADRRSVTLDHEPIPRLMEAMVMEFGVADPSVLAGLQPGARVEGVLRLRGRGPLITELRRRTGEEAPPTPRGSPGPAGRP